MSVKKTVLVIGTKSEIQDLLKSLLEKVGLEVCIAYTASECLELIRSQVPDFVLINLYLNAAEVDDSRLNLLCQLRTEIDLPVIVMGRKINLDCLRTLMRLGVYDYIPLPLHPETLCFSIKSLLELQSRQKDTKQFRKKVNEQNYRHDLISGSPKMMSIIRLIPRIANKSGNVLIVGESGTGKELIARAIHENSPRRYGPFIPLNCSTLPESLAESELFGHERGAFTGAVHIQKGKCEMAYQGTLFLDEIGDMPLSIQPKFLRILDKQSFTRVGGTKPLEMNARVIAATNCNLEQKIQQKAFREDLFYRLNVIRIQVPPLRERCEDIPLLVNHFLSELTKNKKELAPGVMEYLIKQQWRGNVRELRNTIERAVAFSNGRWLHLDDFLLPSYDECSVLQENHKTVTFNIGALLQVIIKQNNGSNGRNLLEFAEEMVIRAAVAQVNGNKSKAANLLGIDRKKVERRIVKYGISCEKRVQSELDLLFHTTE